MAKSRTSPQNSRRLTWGIISTLVIIVLYTTGWFYLASLAKERVRNELAQNADQLQCQSLSVRGYPFSLSVSCSGMSFKDKNQTLHVAASALNVGASIFALRTVQTQLTSPAAIAMSGADPIKADWDGLKASARMGGKSIQDISVTAQKLRLQKAAAENSVENTGDKTAGLELLGMQFDLNSIEEPMKVKMTFEELRLTGNTSLPELPELDGLIDITSPESLAAFNQRDESGSVLRGKSLQLNQLLFLLPTGASISISGPASVDQEGLANADLKIRLTNPAAIGTVLQTAFPAHSRNINTIVFALGSMPKDETGATVVPVTIRNGKASASFIPLGRLPLL